MSVQVRELIPDDWELLRELRITALADAPEAFESTHADALLRTEVDWRSSLAPEAGVRAVAEVDGEPAGLVGVDATDGDLIAMWVAPEHRGTGAGEALVGFAVDWCERHGLRCGLWVVTDNAPARRLYERVGFVSTGVVQPVKGDDTRWELRMEYAPLLHGGADGQRHDTADHGDRE